MSKEKKIKTETIFSVETSTLDVHYLADMNPMQSKEDFLALKYSIAEIGQQEPVVLFKGKIVDGRNRAKALKELAVEHEDVESYKYIKYKKLPTTMSIGELEELVIGKETRRHISPVQKAIKALNYYELKEKEQEKVSMVEVAKKFSTSQGSISKVIAMRKVTGEAIVQRLFNGDKVTIQKAKKDGTAYTVESTSPEAIRNYYRNMVDDSTGASFEERIDPYEMAAIQLMTTEAIGIMSYDGVKYFIGCLQNSADNTKTSYDHDAVKLMVGKIEKETEE